MNVKGGRKSIPLREKESVTAPGVEGGDWQVADVELVTLSGVVVPPKRQTAVVEAARPDPVRVKVVPPIEGPPWREPDAKETIE